MYDISALEKYHMQNEIQVMLVDRGMEAARLSKLDGALNGTYCERYSRGVRENHLLFNNGAKPKRKNKNKNKNKNKKRRKNKNKNKNKNKVQPRRAQEPLGVQRRSQEVTNSVWPRDWKRNSDGVVTWAESSTGQQSNKQV